MLKIKQNLQRNFILMPRSPNIAPNRIHLENGMLIAFKRIKETGVFPRLTPFVLFWLHILCCKTK